MNTTTKYILFYCFVFALCIPAVQSLFKFVDEKPLNGFYTSSEKPKFSKEEWFKGNFQEMTNRVVEEHIGFRATFIRIRNQIEYFLFKKANASNVIVGKEGVLYQDFYIDAYLGKDFLGDEIINQKVEKLAFVQNEMRKRNIFLMFVIAPGKASIYPEYLPDWAAKAPRKISNYDLFSKKMLEKKINFIDMRKYFLQLKNTAEYPLFPKCGTHWSGYSITLVMDTILKYIEHEGHIKMNDFIIEKGFSTKTEFRFTDNDIGSGMNLYFQIPGWEVYYPNVRFVKNSTSKKPNMLSIGDSFTQSFFGFYPFYDELYSDSTRYWYYNKVVSWPDSIEKKYITVESLDLKKEVEQRQLIMIVSTEQNLNNFGFGFVDDVAALYDSSRRLEFEERVVKFVQKIKSDPNWILEIKKKVYAEKVGLDSAIHKDAIYLAQMEEEKISRYERLIKSDPNWLTSVKGKAAEKKVPLAKMIRLDAIWMVEQENKK